MKKFIFSYMFFLYCFNLFCLTYEDFQKDINILLKEIDEEGLLDYESSKILENKIGDDYFDNNVLLPYSFYRKYLSYFYFISKDLLNLMSSDNKKDFYLFIYNNFIRYNFHVINNVIYNLEEIKITGKISDIYNICLILIKINKIYNHINDISEKYYDFFK